MKFIDPSNKSNEPKSAASELDELFGSIRVTSNNQVNISPTHQSRNADQLDDCLPLFPISKTNNQSSVTTTNEAATTKRGGLFDDLQDLLVDQSTGQKISSTKRYKNAIRFYISFIFQFIPINIV